METSEWPYGLSVFIECLLSERDVTGARNAGTGGDTQATGHAYAST